MREAFTRCRSRGDLLSPVTQRNAFALANRMIGRDRHKMQQIS
jgi:hypothetical protein